MNESVVQYINNRGVLSCMNPAPDRTPLNAWDLKIMTWLQFHVKNVKMNYYDASSLEILPIKGWVNFMIWTDNAPEIQIFGGEWVTGTGGQYHQDMSWYTLALTSMSRPHQYSLSFFVACDIFMQFSPFTRMICAWFLWISTFHARAVFSGYF